MKLHLLEDAVQLYQAREGALPASLGGLTDYPGTRLREAHLSDAWGELMRYRATVRGGFVLWSCGPDEVCGTEDDLRREVVGGVRWGKKEDRAAR